MLEKALRSKTKRVRLNLPALEQAIRGQKRAAVAASIPAGSRSSISPSTLTRYLSGERCPSVGEAVRVAAAVGLDPVELILGYAEDRRAKSTTWQSDLASKGRMPLGIDLRRFLQQSAHYLRYFHIGDVVDGPPHRFAFRTLDDDVGFASIPVRVPASELPTVIRVLYRFTLVTGFPLVIDIGEIRVEGNRIEATETWTLRQEAHERSQPDDPFRIRIWQDGNATTYFLISDKPFEVPMEGRAARVAADETGACAVSLKPTGFHRHRAH